MRCFFEEEAFDADGEPRVLDDPDVGLPYWDWAGDGELAAADQPDAPVWAADCMGGQGRPISAGPRAASSRRT